MNLNFQHWSSYYQRLLTGLISYLQSFCWHFLNLLIPLRYSHCLCNYCFVFISIEVMIDSIFLFNRFQTIKMISFATNSIRSPVFDLMHQMSKTTISLLINLKYWLMYRMPHFLIVYDLHLPFAKSLNEFSLKIQLHFTYLSNNPSCLFDSDVNTEDLQLSFLFHWDWLQVSTLLF